MRVIAGKCRSLPLKTLPGRDTRPTTDRIKETLFNVMQNDIPRACFLDLFAGSGAIGIEALSRGAQSCCFVDQSRKAVEVIKENLAFCRLTDQAEVYQMDAVSAVKSLANHEPFDVVFMDPPYRMAHKAAVTAADIINERDLLNDGGIFIVEHSSDLPFVTDVINMKLNRSCSYGLAVLTFFSKND